MFLMIHRDDIYKGFLRFLEYIRPSFSRSLTAESMSVETCTCITSGVEISVVITSLSLFCFGVVSSTPLMRTWATGVQSDPDLSSVHLHCPGLTCFMLF